MEFCYSPSVTTKKVTSKNKELYDQEAFNALKLVASQFEKIRVSSFQVFGININS